MDRLGLPNGDPTGASDAEPVDKTNDHLIIRYFRDINFILDQCTSQGQVIHWARKGDASFESLYLGNYYKSSLRSSEVRVR